jgi:phage terminase small subunit
MGNRPKPAALKRATGNPGRRPIREVQLPDTGAVGMPEYLGRTPRAAALWREYAPALLLLGTLRKESERLFAMWCAETAMYERSPRKFTASRITQIRTLASSLGMDPSAQGKFSTPTDASDSDPAEEFFRPHIERTG